MSNIAHRNTSNPSALATEPVTVGGAVIVFGNAVLGALPLFGVDITADQVGAANLVLAALIVLITVLIRHFTVPKVNVHERQKNGQVIAGEANEVLPEGEVVRPVGQLPERDAEV